MVAVLSRKRQAGVQELEGRGKEASRLRFYSDKDALNYVRQIVNDAEHGFPLENFNIAKGYKKAKIEINAQFVVIETGANCQFAFRAIPNGSVGRFDEEFEGIYFE